MLKALTVLTFWGACCSQKVTLWSVDLRPPAHFEGTLLILRPWITAMEARNKMKQNETKWNKMENKLNTSIQKVQPGHTSNCFPSLQNWAHEHTSNGHLFNRLPCLGNNVVKLCFVQRLFDKCCCPAKYHQKSQEEVLPYCMSCMGNSSEDYPNRSSAKAQTHQPLELTISGGWRAHRGWHREENLHAVGHLIRQDYHGLPMFISRQTFLTCRMQASHRLTCWIKLAVLSTRFWRPDEYV